MTEKEELKESIYDVFISYRRNGGEVLARLVYFMLTSKGYTVFYDREKLKSGRFDENIQNVIESCTDFVLILSPKMFDNIKLEEFNILTEIKIAIKNNKNILPLMMQGFDYNEFKFCSDVPVELIDLDKYHATPVIISTFDYSYIFKNIKLKSQPSNRSGALTEALKSGIDRGTDNNSVFSGVPDTIKKDTLMEIFVSYIGKENSKAIFSMIQPYLDRRFHLKKDFRYIINITSLREAKFSISGLPFEEMENKYCRVYERLSFSKHYIESDGISEFWIAFTFDDGSLDDNLHNEKIYFSETLKLQKRDIDIIKGLNNSDLRWYVDNCFKVRAAVNGSTLKKYDVTLEKSGIYVKYDLSEKHIKIRFKASFEIPFDYNNNYLNISIKEPTYSPEILIRYSDDFFSANLATFFDENMKLTDSASIDGEFEMRAENQWILPMSGAIVGIHKKERGFV